MYHPRAFVMRGDVVVVGASRADFDETRSSDGCLECSQRQAACMIKGGNKRAEFKGRVRRTGAYRSADKDSEE